MSEFITIGEPLVVLAAKDQDLPLSKVKSFERFVAGAELNVAIGMARLGNSVSYVSALGADPFGEFIVDEIEAADIDTSALSIKPDYLTGHYLKQNVSQGDPKIAYYRKDSAAANFSEADLSAVNFDGLKIAHLSGIFPALSESARVAFQSFNDRLNAASVLTVFDPNLRPALWSSKDEMVRVTNELAKKSRIVLPGLSEGETLTGSDKPEEIADFYLNQGRITESVIVKLGSEGAFVKEKNGNSFTVAGFVADQVVDTVGAGDGFAVGLESALLEGWPLKDAVTRACAIGALAVQTPGDNDGYPTREELIEFMNKSGKRGSAEC